MIRHCVFIRLKPGFGAGERAAIYHDLTGLRAKLPGMGKLVAGPNVSPEGLGQGFDDGLSIDFDTAATRDAYLVDPDHQLIGARLVAAAEGSITGILVFDFEL